MKFLKQLFLLIVLMPGCVTAQGVKQTPWTTTTNAPTALTALGATENTTVTNGTFVYTLNHPAITITNDFSRTTGWPEFLMIYPSGLWELAIFGANGTGPTSDECTIRTQATNGEQTILLRMSDGSASFARGKFKINADGSTTINKTLTPSPFLGINALSKLSGVDSTGTTNFSLDPVTGLISCADPIDPTNAVNLEYFNAHSGGGSGDVSYSAFDQTQFTTNAGKINFTGPVTNLLAVAPLNDGTIPLQAVTADSGLLPALLVSNSVSGAFAVVASSDPSIHSAVFFDDIPRALSSNGVAIERPPGTEDIDFNAVGDGSVLYIKSSNRSVGIHTSDPTSTLTVAGSFATQVTFPDEDYSLTEFDSTVFIISDGLTVNLPDPTQCSGRIYTIKQTVTGSSSVECGDGNIDGSPSYTLSAQYKFVTVQSDGTQWFIIGKN